MLKKSGLIVFAVTVALGAAQAQEKAKDSWPSSTVSKDVQRHRFRNVEYTPAQVKTGNSDWVIAKGVHRSSSKDEVATGTISTSGTPTWAISKGAARWQAERNKK